MASLDRAMEVTRKLVAGDLVDAGAQYSTEVATVTQDVDAVGLSRTYQPPYKDDWKWDLLELEFNLALRVKANASATADLIWKAQARNKDGTWVDLFSAVTETDIGTTYVNRNRSGTFILYPDVVQANLDEVPFDVQVLLQSNEATEGRIQVANSSWVRMLMRNSNF